MKKYAMGVFLKPPSLVFAAGIAFLLAASSAQAELVYGVTDEGRTLLSFDSATPANISFIASVSVGTSLQASDFRPSNGVLYGANYSGATGSFRLYTINLGTAVATPVGAAFTLLNAENTNHLSIDFNPVADVLRVVTRNGNSYRVNADTGALLGQDPSLVYGP